MQRIMDTLTYRELLASLSASHVTNPSNREGLVTKYLQMMGRVDCDQGICSWDVGQGARQQEVRQEASEGLCLLSKERQLAIHRLHTQAVTT